MLNTFRTLLARSMTLDLNRPHPLVIRAWRCPGVSARTIKHKEPSPRSVPRFAPGALTGWAMLPPTACSTRNARGRPARLGTVLKVPPAEFESASPP